MVLVCLTALYVLNAAAPRRGHEGFSASEWYGRVDDDAAVREIPHDDTAVGADCDEELVVGGKGEYDGS